jgi:formylglycine-generating enzyme required for sulfatase activity
MVGVGAACVDRYEAGLWLRGEAGSLERFPPSARPDGDREFIAKSEPGVLPQAYISRLEAGRACERAGKRLCSANEWYAACRGAPPTTYPYGARFEAGRCNVGKPHLLTALFGDNPRAWKYDEHFNNPLLDQQKGYLEPGGHYAGCVSSYGAYDMVGNLHEWVSDRVDASLAAKLPMQDGIRRRLRANTGKGVFMGGFFSTTSEHGRGCDFVTIAHEPRYHDYSTGFRCCSDR